MAVHEQVHGWYKDLPGWGKGLVVGGIVILAVGGFFAGRRIIKNIENRKGQGAEKAKENDALNQLQNQGIRATITPAQAAMYADKLFTAMDGYGTDWKTITDVFADVRNDADVLSISKAFGTRTISSGHLNFLTPDLTGTLSQALSDELSDSQKDDLRKTFTSKGIQYKLV